MKVVIERTHTRGTSFDAINNDALSRAIKEQHKDFKIQSVFSDFLTDTQGRQFTFDISEVTGYCRRSFNRLQNGEIEKIVLVLVEDDLQHHKATNSGSIDAYRQHK